MSKISVCIATYNGSLYIKEQLDSILPQLRPTDEILISDDSSRDSTIDIIKSYRDPRIILLENQSFRSPAYNFENALNNASGDYIFLCDQDDVWLSDKVESFIPLLNNYDLVVSDCRVVNADLGIIHDSFFKIMNSGKGFWKNFFKNTYLGCCIAFRKEIFSYILPFPPNIAMHDIWIGLVVELRGVPFFLHKPTSLYRRHGENASYAGEKSKNSIFYKIKYRFNLLQSLVKRQILIKKYEKGKE